MNDKPEYKDKTYDIILTPGIDDVTQEGSQTVLLPTDGRRVNYVPTDYSSGVTDEFVPMNFSGSHRNPKKLFSWGKND